MTQVTKHRELNRADNVLADRAVRNTCRMKRLRKPFRFFRRSRRGASAVEFAVVAPIFFLLVFGMIEIGRAVMVQQIITNASREGARRAVLDGATASEVTSFVNTYLTNASLPSATITYPQGNPENAGFGAPVEVTVSIPFNQVSWLPSPFYLGGETMVASTIMRRESVQ